jgi:hypothetical protein
MLKTHQGNPHDFYQTAIIDNCGGCGYAVDITEDHESVDRQIHHLSCLPICEACNEPVYDGHPDGREFVGAGPETGEFYELIFFNKPRERRPQRDMAFAGHYHRNCFIDAFFPPEEAA